MKNGYSLVNIGFSKEMVGFIQSLLQNSHLQIQNPKNLIKDNISTSEVELFLTEECDLILLNSLAFSCSIIEVIAFLKGKYPLTEIVLISFQKNYQLVINAFREGVRDVIEFPFSENEFLNSLGRALLYRSLVRRSEKMTQMLGLYNLFGDSRKFEGIEQLFAKMDEFLRKNFESDGLVILDLLQLRPTEERQEDQIEGMFANPQLVVWNKEIFEKGRMSAQMVRPLIESKFNRKKLMDLDKSEGPHYNTIEGSEGEFFYFFYLGNWQKVPYVGVFKDSGNLGSEMLGHMARIFFNSFQQVIHSNAEKELSHLAHSDDVTGLYNQRRLQLDIEKAIQNGQEASENFSVLFIDIDHFKKVNDENGHLVGSLVLVELARELRKIVRESDLIYRYGGDEFVIILLNTKKESAREVAQRVLNTLKKKRFHIGGRNEETRIFSLSVSIGVAEYPSDAKSKDEILRLADEMMYLAKEGGRGQIRMVNGG